MLTRLGICCTPKAIYRHNARLADQASKDIERVGKDQGVAVVFDNFEYTSRVAHNQGIGHQDQLLSMTTAAAFGGIEMPPGGLTPGMLHLDRPLRQRDVLQARGNVLSTPELKQISLALITDAITAEWPEAVSNIFSSSTEQPYSMPVIDRLEPAVTKQITLRLISENEGSINGVYKVLDDIFQQLKWPAESHLETDSSVPGSAAQLCPIKTLRLFYGDQKTVSLVRSVMKESVDNDAGADQLGWILPIPGLFHLKMTLVQAIETAFTSPVGCSSKACLSAHKRALHHKLCPSFQAPFSFTEKTILQSSRARTIAFVLEHLAMQDLDIDDFAAVHNHLAQLTATEFNQLVQSVWQRACSPEARQPPSADVRAELEKISQLSAVLQAAAAAGENPAAKKSSKAAAGIRLDGLEERRTHIRFLQIVETYQLLCYGIKHADLGLIKLAVDRCILIFHARSHRNYAFISLWLKWLTDTPAADEQLQRAILANGLFNMSGKPNGWFETDRANEYLNLHLKTLLQKRRTGTFSVDKQLQQCTLLATYTGELRNAMEQQFGIQPENHHTDYSNATEVFHTALICLKETMQTQTATDQLPFLAADLLTTGAQRFAEGRLEAFNQKVVQHADRVVLPDMELAGTTDELPLPETDPRLRVYSREELQPGMIGLDASDMVE